ncbi:MAG: YhfG family protein [Rhodoferax sp.]|uniref:YhfG family protein n=1 Tax=Rhodoferax sp. TaxID=50421 RepID=UPI0032665472
MKTSTILSASNLADLKALGSFREIKTFIENNIDNKLGVKGWDSLYKKIEFLKKAVRLNRNILENSNRKKPLNDCKKEFSKILSIDITARSWQDLKRKIDLVINLFSLKSFDPYVYYEKTKQKKFKDSSRLEGINIESPEKGTSLETIISKYRR